MNPSCPVRLVPKNWKTFQHYRDRTPPWIKLHRELLNDRAYMELPLASKALAPLLWLLACESHDGSFSGDLRDLEFRLRMSKKDLTAGLEGLLRAGFFQIASVVLASCTSEGEREGEGETEREGTRAQAREPCSAEPEAARIAEPEPEKPEPAKAGKRRQVDRPDGVSEQLWSDWIAHRRRKRAEVSATALAGIAAEAEKAGMTLAQALAHSIAQGWQGFRAEWMQARAGPGRSRELIVPKQTTPDYWHDSHGPL